jgi:hypothetical protein
VIAESRRRFTPPFVFSFLVIPTGISSGFVSITLPFILTQAGFSVAAAGYVVALGAAANFLRFTWGPVADFTLTPRVWYLFGLVTTVGTLLLVGWIPLHPAHTALVGTIIFISQVAATLVMLPLGGLMAHTVREEQKGRASGWYQAGNLGGNGIGGGLGIWLTAHYSREIAVLGISILMLVSGLALFFVADVRLMAEETLRQRIRFLAKDVRAIFCSPIPLLIAFLVCTPIGAGGMSHQWGSVWPDWHTTPNSVALVVGVLSSFIAVVGCVLGGWIADRFGLWWAYFGSGIGIALVAIIMAIVPRTPEAFLTGVVAYSFMQGLSYAAFSALVLFAIGGGAASTKYALLCSLGNLPVAYMTALDGWAHDQHGTSWMLHFDAFSGAVFIVIAAFILHRIKGTGAPQSTLEVASN